jgi:hypothetical protein
MLSTVVKRGVLVDSLAVRLRRKKKEALGGS